MTLEDGDIDYTRLLRMRDLLSTWKIVGSALRKAPRVRDRAGRWHHNWTEQERRTVYRLTWLLQEEECPQTSKSA